jgi:TonB family protein
MRIVAAIRRVGLLGLAIALSSGAALARERHDYVRLPVNAWGGAAYWDRAQTEVAGDARQVTILRIGGGADPAFTKPVQVGLTPKADWGLYTFVVSCELGTIRLVPGAVPALASSSDDEALAGLTHAHFPADRSLEDLVVDAACGAEQFPAPGLESLTAALKDGASRPTDDSPARDILFAATALGPSLGFEIGSQPRRFSRLDIPASSGAVQMVDWNSLPKTDATGVVEVLTVLGPGVPRGVRAVRLDGLAFDCQAGTLTLLRDQFWDRDGHPMPNNWRRWSPPSAVLRRRLLNRVCSGHPPADALTSLNAAVASAMSGWGEAPAFAPETPHAEVQWTRRPSADDLGRFYPDRAQRLEVSGRATIQCRAAADLTLTDCAVLSETPPDFGFGMAALMMARRLKFAPLGKDGSPITPGVTVDVPFRYAIPSEKELTPPAIPPAPPLEIPPAPLAR